MVFERILGQGPAVETLRRALHSGRVHHAYRFEGPDGVGKELTAIALAQSLVCTEQTDEGCGTCNACRRAGSLSDEPPFVPRHPDVILVGRGVYTNTLLTSKEVNGISVEQIRRLVLERTGYPPHEGRALVVIVRDAEELTQSAANALLKTLEEPRSSVHFVLLTSRPNRLLDTIRSRTLAVRFGPLPDAIVAQILEQHEKPQELAAMAQGSASAALQLAEPERREQLAEFARAMANALSYRDASASLELAGNLPRDRHEVAATLLAYGQLLAVENRTRAAQDVDEAARVARRYGVLQQALTALERNVMPALAVEAMLMEMRKL